MATSILPLNRLGVGRGKKAVGDRDVGSTIKVGAHKLRGALAGFMELRVSALSGGGVKNLVKRQNILYVQKGLILRQ